MSCGWLGPAPFGHMGHMYYTPQQPRVLLPHRCTLRYSPLQCQYFNDSLAFHSPEFLNLGVKVPPINIGVLYFRASAAMTRCVYNWVWDMHIQAPDRPKIWDQVGCEPLVVTLTAAVGWTTGGLQRHVQADGGMHEEW